MEEKIKLIREFAERNDQYRISIEDDLIYVGNPFIAIPIEKIESVKFTGVTIVIELYYARVTLWDSACISNVSFSNY